MLPQKIIFKTTLKYLWVIVSLIMKVLPSLLRQIYLWCWPIYLITWKHKNNWLDELQLVLEWIISIDMYCWFFLIFTSGWKCWGLFHIFLYKSFQKQIAYVNDQTGNVVEVLEIRLLSGWIWVYWCEWHHVASIHCLLYNESLFTQIFLNCSTAMRSTKYSFLNLP